MKGALVQSVVMDTGCHFRSRRNERVATELSFGKSVGRRSLGTHQNSEEDITTDLREIGM